MNLDFAVLADGVAPRPDGKLDIFGAGFDTIFAPGVPATHERLTLVIRLLVSRHEAEHPHRLDVIIQSADGLEISRATGPVEPLSPDIRSRIPAGRQAALPVVLNFPPLVFPSFGDYHIVIQWDGNEARPPLRLIVAPTPSAD